MKTTGAGRVLRVVVAGTLLGADGLGCHALGPSRCGPTPEQSARAEPGPRRAPEAASSGVEAHAHAHADTAPAGAEPTPSLPEPGPALADSKRPPRLTRVLEGEQPRLHAMADGGLMLSVGPQLYRVTGGRELEEDPELLRGLPSPFCLDDRGNTTDWRWNLHVTGRWPDGLFVSYWVAPPPNTERVVRKSFRWRDGAFAPMHLGGDAHSFYYADSRPYVDGSVLSLRRFEALPPEGFGLSECFEDNPRTLRKCSARFAAVRRVAEASKPLVVTRGQPKGPDLAEALGHRPPLLAGFDSLASGHVFAATLEDRARMLVVTPPRATLTALPGSPDEPLRIRAVRAYAPELVFAVGGEGSEYDEPRPRIYRYDGRAWSEQSTPPCAEDTEVWWFEQTPDGQRFASCLEPPESPGGIPNFDAPVWWQAPGAEWRALGIEGQMLAQHAGNLWVADNKGVLTTEPRRTTITAKSRETLDRIIVAEGPPCLDIEHTW